MRAQAEKELARARQPDIDAVDALLAELPEDVRGSATIGEGEPGQGLVDLTPDYDLVLVGTLERTGVARLVLGSVAEFVVRNAKCSVLTLPAINRPLLAECGGMMVLFDTLTDTAGATHRLAGLLPGTVGMRGRLAAIGPQQLDPRRAGSAEHDAGPGAAVELEDLGEGALQAVVDATDRGAGGGVGRLADEDGAGGSGGGPQTGQGAEHGGLLWGHPSPLRGPCQRFSAKSGPFSRDISEYENPRLNP